MTRHSGDPLRVVLIDDTPDIRLLLRMALEAGGRFRVVAEAGDGATGVDEVARSQPDVVLVDLAMPVLDGLDALPGLRRACPGARIVVLSGFDSARLLARTTAAGADGYLQKGLDPWDLEERLLRIVSSSAPRSARPAPPPARRPARARAVRGAHPRRPGPRRRQRRRRWRWRRRRRRPPVGPCAERQRRGTPAARRRPHRGRRGAPARRAGGRGSRARRAPARRRRADRVRRPRSGRRAAGHAHTGPERSSRLPAAVAGGRHHVAAGSRRRGRSRDPQSCGGHLRSRRRPPRSAAGKGAPDGRRADLLQALARQARLLDRATGDLLAAAQAQREALHVEPRPVVLAEVLASAVADAPAGEHVTLDCPPRLVVHADPERVQQMVHNLLANAAKYGSPPVTVRAGPDAAGAGAGAGADAAPAPSGSPSRTRARGSRTTSSPRSSRSSRAGRMPPRRAPASDCPWCAPWPGPRAAGPGTSAARPVRCSCSHCPRHRRRSRGCLTGIWTAGIWTAGIWTAGIWRRDLDAMGTAR